MVERVQSKRRRVMRKLRIAEISAVDNPSVDGARAVLAKRDSERQESEMEFEKIIERPRSFATLEEACAHLAKMEAAARDRPDELARFNAEGLREAAEAAEQIAKARATPPAVAVFNKRVDQITARDRITKLAALERARVEHPDEFDAYQEA